MYVYVYFAKEYLKIKKIKILILILTDFPKEL